MVRWLRWHCPPDTGFEIRALAVWGRARYLSVTEAPHNTNFHTWMGKKHFCFFQTAETGNRTPNSGVKGSGANHYPRAPALHTQKALHLWNHKLCWGVNGYICKLPLFFRKNGFLLNCVLCEYVYMTVTSQFNAFILSLINCFNSYSAGIDFSRQNLTSVDVRRQTGKE